MICFHKILPTFSLPVMLIILAIGIQYIISKPKLSKNLIKLKEGSEYRKSINPIDSQDTIVGLSGMMEINKVGDSNYVKWEDRDRFLKIYYC